MGLSTGRGGLVGDGHASQQHKKQRELDVKHAAQAGAHAVDDHRAPHKRGRREAVPEALKGACGRRRQGARQVGAGCALLQVARQ